MWPRWRSYRDQQQSINKSLLNEGKWVLRSFRILLVRVGGDIWFGHSLHNDRSIAMMEKVFEFGFWLLARFKPGIP